ncbi:MAG TPA: hypothetical protein VFF89_08625 [Sphingobium sp.]|nr:hypothetical protein [Sphingobium sp.]
MSVFVRIAQTVGDRSVRPPLPGWCKPWVDDAEAPSAPATRDHSASWSGYIRYVNAQGQESQRRIVCRRIEGFGRAETIGAWCCERKAHKRFRVDRIQELVCLQTGEILDPLAHFENLRLRGALNVIDKSLADIGRILVFMAKCDGYYHPLEVQGVTDTMERYVLRFGGDDNTLETAARNVARLAPDGEDFIAALRKVQLHPQSSQLARLILEGVSAVIDADGRYTAEEIEWAEVVVSELKRMAA